MGRNWQTVLESRWIYWLLVAGALALRLPHLSGPIDDPHSWRQCDTAHYALDFYRNGIDLLRPQVCWSGLHGTLALEFPLHEALVALLYGLFGFDHLWARLVTLAFFAGSLVYLHAIVDLVGTRRLARYTGLVYAVLPMSLFYSRAVHVDFAATFFGHAMLYHLLRGFDRRRPAHVVLGAILGSAGFVIKAPYLFYLYLPLGAFLLQRRVWQGRHRAWLLVLILPILAFLAWRWHVGQVNADKPALDIYPEFVERWEWYFGTVEQRLDIGNWLVLLRRLIFDVANPVGLLLLAWGVWAWVRSGTPTLQWFFESWALGAAAYVLIFFNLNWIHNYYQIPLLAIASVFIAACLDKFADLRPPVGTLVSAVLLALLVGVSLWYTGRAYHYVDWRTVRAGLIIRAQTAPDDLVVAYLYDDNDDYSDPRLLYRARRKGWSIRPVDITPERIATYALEGASTLAIVESEPDPRVSPEWLGSLPGQHFALSHNGEPLGTLHLYDLSSPP